MLFLYQNHILSFLWVVNARVCGTLLARRNMAGDPVQHPTLKSATIPKELPSDVSMAFEMSPDNLFVVWYAQFKGAPQFRRKDDFYAHWCLADPKQGWEQIKAQDNNGCLLAALSLRRLLALDEQLSKIPSWWKLSNTYAIPKEEGDGVVWVRKKPSDFLLQVKAHVIKELATEGKLICGTRDYKRVLHDHRPACEGKPVDWIHFMRNPNLAWQARLVQPSRRVLGAKHPNEIHSNS